MQVLQTRIQYRKHPVTGDLQYRYIYEDDSLNGWFSNAWKSVKKVVKKVTKPLNKIANKVIKAHTDVAKKVVSRHISVARGAIKTHNRIAAKIGVPKRVIAANKIVTDKIVKAHVNIANNAIKNNDTIAKQVVKANENLNVKIIEVGVREAEHIWKVAGPTGSLTKIVDPLTGGVSWLSDKYKKDAIKKMAEKQKAQDIALKIQADKTAKIIQDRIVIEKQRIEELKKQALQVPITYSAQPQMVENYVPRTILPEAMTAGFGTTGTDIQKMLPVLIGVGILGLMFVFMPKR